jgi:DNA-binding FadR family transcriptional regulator
MVRSPDKPAALLARLPPAQSRTGELIERLKTEIAAGRFDPGARLPTEIEMMTALGVSRTVVREAVAALRAEGLVETRQGVGAFVARDVQRRPFRIDPAGLASLEAVIQIMELRTGIEVEAAGLAAERAGAESRARIGEALNAIDQALAEGEAAIEQDFAFHRRIAEATANPQFVRFLEFLGHFLIPRQSVRAGLQDAEANSSYLARIQTEHRRIAAAITAADPPAARRAMHRHLMNSRTRYRGLAAAAVPATDNDG